MNEEAQKVTLYTLACFGGLVVFVLVVNSLARGWIAMDRVHDLEQRVEAIEKHQDVIRKELLDRLTERSR